jgi:hypothetical protein
LAATASATAEAVAPAWAEATVRAALRVAGGQSLAGLVATTVLELWRETLRGMLMSKLKHISAGLALMALAAAGAGRDLNAREPAKPVGAATKPARADDPKQADGGAALIDDKTDAAIRKGLDWLEAQQKDDGSFGPEKYKVAVTSLAGMALLGSGSEPGRGDRGARIDRAIKYLLDHADETTGFFDEGGKANSPMYGHGFAALFLAECYAKARRPELRTAIEKSVALLADTQNAEGGWRYLPRKADADLSVTAGQINALRAARRAGIAVPHEVMTAAIRYAASMQNPDGGFRYLGQGGVSGFPRSAGGVLSLMAASESVKVDRGARLPYAEEIDRGYKYIHDHGLQPRDPHFFYAQYYAVQALRLRGGDGRGRLDPMVRVQSRPSPLPPGRRRPLEGRLRRRLRHRDGPHRPPGPPRPRRRRPGRAQALTRRTAGHPDCRRKSAPDSARMGRSSDLGSCAEDTTCRSMTGPACRPGSSTTSTTGGSPSSRGS